MEQKEILKMLRAIANTQSAMRGEMLEGFKKNEQDHEKINSRLDLIGSDLAYLNDDAPTSQDFNKLEKRVTKIEKKLALN